MHQEELKWIDGLIEKGASRFLRVHDHLRPHPIYTVMKHDLSQRKQLTNLIKIISYPERCHPEECSECSRVYTDTMYHYIMECPALLAERNMVWESVLGTIKCEQEVYLMNLEDKDQFDIILSKEWEHFVDKTEYYTFIKAAAEQLMNIIRIM